MQKIRGRTAQFNPRNRFEKLYINQIDDADYGEDETDELKKIETVFYKDLSRTVIAKNDSPDIGFDYSFNPYRGCEHGCIYCYARPSHEFLGFSSGTDFETKIMVKEDAASILKKEFQKKSYVPKVIIFSGNTDCYQPVERKLKITREALKVCLEFSNPVSIITKNSLIERDIDILQKLAQKHLVRVMLSVTTLDNNLARIMEPRTSTPERRLRTIKFLSENKISVGVNVAPVIPGLNDKEIPSILEESSRAGAVFASKTLLRLPYSVKELFVNWLHQNLPERENKIIGLIKQVRNGKLNDSEFGKRFSGEGEIAEVINNLFEISCKKFGLNRRDYKLDTKYFSNNSSGQLELFL